MNKIFKKLFVLDMANNHQGSLEHGLKIIDETAEVMNRHSLNATVKLQYRQLDSFIHPDFKERTDVPHIPRFLSTRLTNDDLQKLVKRTHERGLRTLVTPFDEESVEVCLQHEVEILKVASCSATDWPLLDAIADSGKPVIVSTGGLKIDDIDNLISFFMHKGCEFAVMHCVGIYPTPSNMVNMGVVKRLIDRYPDLPIGYSGHETPDNLSPIRAAVACGAQMFERHVGVPTDEIVLNKYSMNPIEVEAWVEAALETFTILGDDRKVEISNDEISSLMSLQRGVYAKQAIRRGSRISQDDVYFAMPCQNGQLTSGQFGRYRTNYVASKDYAADETIQEEAKSDQMINVRTFIHQAKGMLNEARIHLGNEYEVELSHHYGIDEFRKTGALIVTLVNREYCKKLVVLLPGQAHPNHRHLKKEETFQLLAGDLCLVLNGIERQMKKGDKALVERGTWHSFSSENGAIFEEVSTTHTLGDSYYEDNLIASLDVIQRKTVVEQW
jgi:N-acetylneuraminate synthase